MPAVAPMPSASETMATAVTTGVPASVRIANLRLRITALDERRYPGVYRLRRSRPARAGPPAYARDGLATSMSSRSDNTCGETASRDDWTLKWQTFVG